MHLQTSWLEGRLLTILTIFFFDYATRNCTLHCSLVQTYTYPVLLSPLHVRFFYYLKLNYLFFFYSLPFTFVSCIAEIYWLVEIFSDVNRIWISWGWMGYGLDGLARWRQKINLMLPVTSVNFSLPIMLSNAVVYLVCPRLPKDVATLSYMVWAKVLRHRALRPTTHESPCLIAFCSSHESKSTYLRNWEYGLN